VTFASGCGGDQQDADEPKGAFEVDVISATFPGRQRLAQKTKLEITVKNTGGETIPNLGVTLDGLDKRLNDPNLSDPERPIWILNRPPYDSVVAYTNTYAVGKLEPGKTRSMRWSLTAVRPGTYTVRYQVSAGLDGKAKAQLADGTPAKGSFLVRISSVPRPVPDPIT
jgi:hypothetical protein